MCRCAVKGNPRVGAGARQRAEGYDTSKTFAGADCSGLIQTALAAAGIRAPRDTDMMERHFADSPRDSLERGDIIFWKGHMGVMLDETRLLHANAFHMLVVIEPVAEAIARFRAS